MSLDYVYHNKAQKLPLIETFLKSFNAKDTLDFSNVLLICVQHLFSTTYSMFSVFFEFGLRPENLFVMGKCYSTRPEVLKKMIADGISVSPLSTFYDSHEAFDDFFLKNLDKELMKFLSRKRLENFDKVILLDEGGNLISLFEKKFSSAIDFLGVEQTSSGYNKLKSQKISFPVINVARSRAKLVYETPLVIKLCINRLKKHIYNLNSYVKDILILGGGVIGSAMTRELEKEFCLTVLDKNNYEDKNYKIVLASLLPNFDAIIGCTGECSIPEYFHCYLKKPSFLISASSSDREFDAVSFRKKVERNSDCHRDLLIEGVCLVNSGFPYPFDGNYEEIDLEEFQLTRMLLIAGVFQAYLDKNLEKGFIEFDESLENKIINYWERSNRSNLTHTVPTDDLALEPNSV